MTNFIGFGNGGKVPSGFWKDRNNQRKYFDWLGNALGIKQLDDWYKITYDQVKEKGARTLLFACFNSSLAKALQSIYPYHPWTFNQVSTEIRTNQRKVFNRIAEHLKISLQEDWYTVTQSQLRKVAKKRLLEQYNGTLYNALETVYPEFEWYAWRFTTVPKGFWSVKENHKKYFLWLGDVLGIKEPEEWYKVPRSAFIEAGGFHLTTRYNRSHIYALCSVFEEYNLKPYNFVNVPKSYWQNIEHHKRYLDSCAMKLGIRELDDWYKIKVSELEERASTIMHHRYDNSLFNMLKAVYPHHPWKPWLFDTVDHGFWKDEKNIELYVDWLEDYLGIDQPEDWSGISTEFLYSLKGSRILHLMGGISNFLAKYRPEAHSYFEANTGKVQKFLAKMLRDLFSTSKTTS